MNKIVSQAIKKAVSEYKINNVPSLNEDKRPDLFSLSPMLKEFSFDPQAF